MIRNATESDESSIVDLLNDSFSPSRYESRLFRLVMRSGEPYFHWVFEEGTKIIGYILYSEASNQNGIIGYHLAPLAVDPMFQSKGIGSLLVRESIVSDSLKDESVFVLGDPRYYERFGFGASKGIVCPYDEGGEHFRVLRYDSEESFTVGYLKAFAEAESGGRE